MRTSHLLRSWAWVAPAAAIAIGVVAGARPAGAADAEKSAWSERCATRLSIALLGKTAAPESITAADPQTGVDAMLTDPLFVERFSRFVNATFNEDPGATAEQDAPYYLAKRILESNKPWKEIFIGPYDVGKDASGTVVVSDKADGLGYFRSVPWLKRYAGNEASGLKISTAYHMLNNVIGLRLVAATNAPGVDISATGRKVAPCNSCHYDNWYALDKTAMVLTKAVHSGMNVSFSTTTYSGQPQQILGGKTVANDKELVNALVEDPSFTFRTCRIAFEFLYGRDENKCEGQVFDHCVDAFNAQGTVQAAIGAIAKDPTFCQ